MPGSQDGLHGVKQQFLQPPKFFVSGKCWNLIPFPLSEPEICWLVLFQGQVVPSTAVGLRQPWPFVAAPLQSLQPLEKLLQGVMPRQSGGRVPAGAAATEGTVLAAADAGIGSGSNGGVVQPAAPQLRLLEGSVEAVSLLKIQFEVDHRQAGFVPAGIVGVYENFTFK